MQRAPRANAELGRETSQPARREVEARLEQSESQESRPTPARQSSAPLAEKPDARGAGVMPRSAEAANAQPSPGQSSPAQPFASPGAGQEAVVKPADASSPTFRPAAAPTAPSAERVEAAMQVQASEVRRTGDATRLTVVVEDDRLGSLALRIAERSGGVDVVLRADNPAAARQFQNSLPQLYENLFYRGLQPDARAWTPTAGGDADRQQQDQQNRERESRQGPRQRRERRGEARPVFSIPTS